MGFVYFFNILLFFGVIIIENMVFEVIIGYCVNEFENSCVIFFYDKNKDGVVL